MGKRRNSDPDYIKKKIRKLEKKLEKITEEDPEIFSSPCSPPAQSPPSLQTPLLPPVDQQAEPLPSPALPTQNILEQEHTTDDGLPEELLQALGTEGEENVEVGEPIRPELANRWTRIIQTGLSKESRDAIIKKYPMPSNFPRAVAPTMNPEISASLADPSLKRDKRICYRQNLTGKLMTCLGKSLSKILTGNINSKTIVEEMNDAAKLAAEIYHQDSASRRFFALAGVNKVVQDAVRTAESDDTLFGTDCAEKIKAAQAIQKTGSLIKTTEKKTFKSNSKKQGNWRGPPQYQQQQQRARGGHPPRQQQRPPRPEQTNWKTRKPAPSSSKSRYRR